VSTLGLMSGINYSTGHRQQWLCGPEPPPPKPLPAEEPIPMCLSSSRRRQLFSGVMSTVESEPLTLATEGSSVEGTVTATDKAGQHRNVFISEP